MNHTTDSVLKLIAENDTAAATALLALLREGYRFWPGDEVLYSYAAQVRARKASKGRELLASDQLGIWRSRVYPYLPSLVRVLNRKK